MTEAITNFEKDPDADIRTFTPEDAQEYFDLIRDNSDHFGKFADSPLDKYPTVESVEKALSDPDKKFYGIYYDGELVGVVELKPAEHEADCAEIAVKLIDDTNPDIATTAILRVIKKERDYKKFIAPLHTEDSSNQKVLESAGFADSGQHEHGKPVFRYERA